jgi:hypothetical protein
MWLETAFGGFYVLSTAVAVLSYARLRSFLAQTPSIADEACLARYKELARGQMYLALGSITLLLGGLVAGVLIILRHGPAGLVAVLLANGVVLACGLVLRGVEKTVRSLSTGSEALAREYRRVSEGWVKKPFPDF